jgi:hypothetical protein
MTEKPRLELVKPLLAEVLLSVGAGVAIALVIYRIVKYPRHE